jgi:hypothetical protein
MIKKQTLSKSSHKIYFISLVVFLIIALFSAFLRFQDDLKNMKVNILFQDDPSVFFYTSDTSIPETAKYVILKDATNINIKNLIESLDTKKFGVLEFNESENLAKEIAKNLPKEQILYVHYIKPEELKSYNENTLFKRLWRAVIERSIDLIVIPRDSLTEIVYSKFVNFFEINEPSSYIPSYDFQKIFGIILGIFVGFYFPYVLSLFPLYYFSYTLFISAMSIFGTLVLFFKIKDPLLTFFSFFLLGIFTNLSLYDFYHLNNLEVYRGVKISLLLLPSFLLLLLLIRRKLEIKGTLKFFIPLFVIFGIYYIFRSGNNGYVLSIEKNLRESIENIFIIRPRTKELLFYPLLFLSTSINKKVWKEIFEIFGSVALVSTFNTFCHIRAPIFINIYRELITILIALSVYGIIKIFIRKGDEYEFEENENSSYDWSGH